MLSLLLDNLADPNIREVDLTAMHYACENLADPNADRTRGRCMSASSLTHLQHHNTLSKIQ